jgi:hypothetical protein
MRCGAVNALALTAAGQDLAADAEPPTIWTRSATYSV